MDDFVVGLKDGTLREVHGDKWYIEKGHLHVQVGDKLKALYLSGEWSFIECKQKPESGDINLVAQVDRPPD